MPKQEIIDELKTLARSKDKEYYNIEDMWPEDLSDALASGDIPKLQEAWEKGWNVNMPLKNIYVDSWNRDIKDAAKSYERIKFAPFPGFEECYCEEDSRKKMKQSLAENIFAEIVFPITWAIRHNCVDAVQWLIRHGALLDIKNYPSGEWIEHKNQHAALAAIKVSKEMLSLVVDNGAKVKDKTFDDLLFNSLHEDNFTELMPILMGHGADIEAAMKAVLMAVYDGNIKKIEMFLQAGFDINCHTGKGENFLKDTMLGHAAKYGTPETVRYLLAHGADPMICNAKGMLPYMLALQNHKLENAAILRDLCDPLGEERKKAQEKLPQDIMDYLKGGERRLELGRNDIAFIDFLGLDEVALLRLNRRKCVLLSKEVQNFSTIWIVWNTTRKTVAYYDYEHDWYGEFKASFTKFLEEINKYITGIFRDDYKI